MALWEPTGKKATDRTTGAKLVEEGSTVTTSTRWAVYVDGALLGYVKAYLGVVDKKAPGSRIVHSRTEKTMWSCVRARKEGMPYQREWYGHATRARAVFMLINY